MNFLIPDHPSPSPSPFLTYRLSSFSLNPFLTIPTYTGISSEAFRHPLDRQAEQALRSVPGFDLVARKFVEFFAERPRFF